MASTRIAKSDTDGHRTPVRATNLGLKKWPESNATFARSISSNDRIVPATPRPYIMSVSTNGRLDGPSHPRVVDSRSCRQLYLRSYTFSRKESMQQKARKCVGRVKETVVVRNGGYGGGMVIKRAKVASCNALTMVFRRVLFCSAKVAVMVDQIKECTTR